MRHPFNLLLTVGLVCFGPQSAANDSADFMRNPNEFPVVEEEVETSLAKIVSTAQPKQVVLGSDGSTFDLWVDGVMHLEWAPKRVLVYPLKYLGSFPDDIAVFQEDSPDAWIWYFYPDGRLYYYAQGSGPHLYDTKARFYERLP
jgi:hypothetical protein